MSEPIKIQQDGFAIVEFVDGATNQSSAVRVDIFRAANAIRAIQAKYQDGEGGDLEHYIDLVKKLGGPEIAGVNAIQFVNAIIAESERLGELFTKKPSSPQSSASPAS